MFSMLWDCELLVAMSCGFFNSPNTVLYNGPGGVSMSLSSVPEFVEGKHGESVGKHGESIGKSPWSNLWKRKRKKL